MIVLTPTAYCKNSPPTILLFGVGLVGSAILAGISSIATYEAVRLNFSWDNEHEQIEILSKVVDLIRDSDQVEIIWSAGKAGFFSDQHEIQLELKIFKSIIEFLNRNINGDKSLRLVSSAGGLYEGKRIVGRNTNVAPKRVYGELKQSQEEYMLDLIGFKHKTIVRLSSVYGYIRKGQRLGLIPTLIKNGLENRETRIFGQLHTLRDYLFIDDITRFFVEKVLFNEAPCEVLLVSSNKPTSILEIIKIAGNILGKKVHIKFSPSKNSEDITYYDYDNPAKAHLTSLNVGMKKVLLDFESNRHAR